MFKFGDIIKLKLDAVHRNSSMLLNRDAYVEDLHYQSFEIINDSGGGIDIIGIENRKQYVLNQYDLVDFKLDIIFIRKQKLDKIKSENGI